MTANSFAEGVGRVLASASSKRIDSGFGRFYQIGEHTYPSVTHILSVIGKPALINWAANTERTLVMEAAAELYLDLAKIPTPMAKPVYLTTLQSRLGKTKAHQRELAKAGDIGTQVHTLIEWNLRRSLGHVVGPEPRVVDDATWAFMAWQDWAASVDLKPVHIEQTVWSAIHAFAGTMDLLAYVRGVLTLIDVKTGKAIYPEAHLQNIAYQVALAEMGHSTPKAGLIVRLPKVQTDPAFEVAEVPPVSMLLPVFLAVKTLWTWSYANDVAYRERVATQKTG